MAGAAGDLARDAQAGLVLGIIVAFVLALMLKARIRGTTFYRTVFYLPSLVPTVAAVIVWVFIFETRRGILNYALELVGLPAIRWRSDPNWAIRR